MALIENIKGRRKNQSPSGYTRLFGNIELGNLMSKIQGTVISSGTELEKIIWDNAQQIIDLDDFIVNKINSQLEGVWVAKKDQVKKSKHIKSKYEPDFVAFQPLKKICYIMEIKDGDQFDTKKSNSEYVALHDFTNRLRDSMNLTYLIKICCFNAIHKEEIYNGLKRKFSMSEILTGKELCELLNIKYDYIINIRKQDQRKNLDYFIKSLLLIPDIKNTITTIISNYNLEAK